MCTVDDAWPASICLAMDSAVLIGIANPCVVDPSELDEPDEPEEPDDPEPDPEPPPKPPPAAEAAVP